MTKRSYRQYCSVAHALDLVGERWALLIVRELILGPKRFRELHEGLPGSSTNVLSNRLKELETTGVIRRRLLPRPASGTVYELTEYGRELEDIVVALGRWGAKTIQPKSAGQAFKPEWFVVALLGSFRPESARGIRATYELRLDGTVFHLRIERGRLEHGRGPAKDADLVIETDSDSLFAVLMGQITAADAVAAGNVKIDGSLDELQTMSELFALREAGDPGDGGREAAMSTVAAQRVEGPRPRELTPEEARAEFDRRARRLLGMSGAEFLRRYDAGEFDDDDRVAELAFLSPLGR